MGRLEQNHLRGAAADTTDAISSINQAINALGWAIEGIPHCDARRGKAVAEQNILIGVKKTLKQAELGIVNARF